MDSEEKKVYKGKSRSYNVDVQKKSQGKFKEDREAAGKIRYEISAVEKKVKDDFTTLAYVCDLSAGELLKAMVKFCDMPEFKRYAIDKEYLENKPDSYII